MTLPPYGKCSLLLLWTARAYPYLQRSQLFLNEASRLGSGCGSVGRAVAFDSRGPRFESRYRQNNYIDHLLSTVLKR